MNILITGANGFIGRNLVAELRNNDYNNIYEFTRQSDPSMLEEYTKSCDFVFHLAGVNRSEDNSEFMEGNHHLTLQLLESLKKHNNKAPVLITSSIQAENKSHYGVSKKAAENIIFNYQNENDVKVYVYRLPNIFGKWSKPNYNTVVATFCHNISRDIDIQINNSNTKLNLCYIDDVLEEFLKALHDNATFENGFNVVPVTYNIELGELAELIQSFKLSRKSLEIPKMNDSLTKKLYSTYLSFLPEEQFSYDLKMNIDNRGSFTEFLRTKESGQVSVNISKPGITKGNHWHHTKNEKFLVVSGEGLIRFRKLNSDYIIEYNVNGENLQVVDIPVGYTHSIVNIGEEDLVTVMWVNECFNPAQPDTYFLEV